MAIEFDPILGALRTKDSGNTYTNGTGLSLTGNTFSLSIPVAVANGGTGNISAYTTGSVIFADGSGNLNQSNSKLFWDNGNNRLGINTTSPASDLDVRGNFLVANSGTITKEYRFRTDGGALDFEAAGAQWFISNWSGAGFTGTQRFYLVLESGVSVAQMVGQWQGRTAPNGSQTFVLDASTGLISPVQAPTVSAPSYQLGAMYFDTTLNKLRIGGATAWETVTSV